MKPFVGYLHAFGQLYYIYIIKEARKLGIKMELKALDKRFVGYIKFNKVYRIYISGKRTIKEVRNVIFAPFRLY